MEGASQARATGSKDSPGGVPLAVLIARLSQAELCAMLEHHEGAHAHALQDVEVRAHARQHVHIRLLTWCCAVMCYCTASTQLLLCKCQAYWRLHPKRILSHCHAGALRLRRAVLAPNMHPPSETLRASAVRDAQGADALVKFAGEQMDKALQLHNYATVSADNAEHRRFHAARAVALLQSATGAAPPPVAAVGGGGCAGGELPGALTPPVLLSGASS